MTAMTPEQLAEIRRMLGPTPPAAPDLVSGTVRTILQAAHRVQDTNARRALLAVPALAKRLVDAETERTTLRSTIARLIAANAHGDGYGLADLAWELERAGLDLKADYAEADALAEATAREGWTL